jgi:hypothetical protein
MYPDELLPMAQCSRVTFVDDLMGDNSQQSTTPPTAAATAAAASSAAAAAWSAPTSASTLGSSHSTQPPRLSQEEDLERILAMRSARHQ